MPPDRDDLAAELEAIDRRLEAIEKACTASDGKLGQLVEFERRRDSREEAALAIERERREQSAEEHAAVTAAELAERSARGAWVRSLVTPTIVTSIVSGIVGILGTLLVGGGVSAMQASPAIEAKPAAVQEPP